jgi:hypothetical protein
MQPGDAHTLLQHGAWQQQLAGHLQLLFVSVRDVLPPFSTFSCASWQHSNTN